MTYYNPLIGEEKKKGCIRGGGPWDVKGRIGVGYHSSINGSIKVRGQVLVGKYCAIGDSCRLIAASHDTQIINMQIWLQNKLGLTKGGASKGPIVVGNNVWIGDGVTVLSGVTIGDGAVLGAGSVITKDVEPFSIVGGSPSKHIRFRFSKHVREQLLRIKWWDWSDEVILNNADFFSLSIGPEEDLDLSAYIPG
ncbi:CatB-related O-acetyltransferase [Microbulbifer sp. SSSA008]|uniref:CatB-related O-acetyltransferase n=1 Tax=Microbulbifer sp. SSSA008 TaxID=3243380 RepID=UPI004039E74D